MTVKRILDFLGSSVALILVFPFLLAISLLIAVKDGLPILFSQTRPGLNGQPFTLRKFRTMSASKGDLQGAESDAERTSGLGRFLRSTSLDELPTLWNVVKGDMSLVGPRPLLMEYLSRYSPEQARRHEVRPGVTGWAQVNGRNAISWEEKFNYDVWYVDNRSLWLDLRILALTLAKVFQREGISSEHHATMPEFMGSSTGEVGAKLDRRKAR
jgi:lipopolysaccharide/colanic/teichoic acid biosynthesis glycosyltransferase